MRSFLSTLLVIVSAHAFSQEIVRNLDFEQIDFRRMPIGWSLQNKKNTHLFLLDTAIKHSGNVSVSIAAKYQGEKSPGLVNTGLIAPDFTGHKTIKIIGYIRTEHLAEGTASLWMKHRSSSVILAGVKKDVQR
ncbi:hypothetical protein [Parapedobacter sp. 10938]|uniref:hypothetical protein n=1 Tax=Parapedobacter flavus TaxID=3110225 RepID=UPI002DB8F813|nr:hypothetical protein [Parapedobacter sp. 10938]MEC3878500.1 hypothetical protein [Parapedobacter sp. 10938]